MAIEFKVELANKEVRGRVVGSLYGVATYIDGRRNSYVLRPQSDESVADGLARRLNAKVVDGTIIEVSK